MCNKCNKKHTNTNKKDVCMGKICWLINNYTKYKTLGACCGHGKYPMTIVVTAVGNYDGRETYSVPIEYFSQIEIPRKRNFYKRDKKGIFYLPEVK